MVSPNITRFGGILLLGVFALNVYIGLYDNFLRTLQPLHWDINWVLAVANLVAGLLLIVFSRKLGLVVLAGIIWPIVYVLSLGVDVYTRLCIGGSQANCWPTRTAAFDYLILNEPKIPNAAGYGWQLFQGTIPIALALLLIAFIISAISAFSLRKGSRKSATMSPPMGNTTSPGSSGGSGISPSQPPSSGQASFQSSLHPILSISNKRP